MKTTKHITIVKELVEKHKDHNTIVANIVNHAAKHRHKWI